MGFQKGKEKWRYRNESSFSFVNHPIYLVYKFSEVGVGYK